MKLQKNKQTDKTIEDFLWFKDSFCSRNALAVDHTGFNVRTFKKLTNCTKFEEKKSITNLFSYLDDNLQDIWSLFWNIWCLVVVIFVVVVFFPFGDKTSQSHE